LKIPLTEDELSFLAETTKLQENERGHNNVKENFIPVWEPSNICKGWEILGSIEIDTGMIRDK